MIAIQNCQHYNLFNSLYDLCRKDWEQWNQQHDIESESVNAGKVYRAETLDDKCGWWGVPVVHFYKKTKWGVVKGLLKRQPYYVAFGTINHWC